MFTTDYLYNIIFLIRYKLNKPEHSIPISHITFLEPYDDPNNKCYFWVIQSDHSELSNATMFGLTFKEKTLMSNGFSSYEVSKIELTGLGIVTIIVYIFIFRLFKRLM